MARPSDAILTIDDVRAAAERLAQHVLRTPTLECGWLSDLNGRRVTVKWESLQETGSFKLRGALHKLIVLRAQGVRRVLTVSAGNHGLGVAEAARRLGMRATVCVPDGAVETKVRAIVRRGAELRVLRGGWDEAEAAARQLALDEDVPFVSPYNDAAVIAGQATVTLELLEQARPAHLVVPTGGGGLLAGAAIVVRALSPSTIVWGAQPEHAPALHHALRAGRRVEVEERPTLADGLAGNVEAGSITLPLVAGSGVVRDVALVSERAIRDAIRGFAAHDHQIVEGSGAVGAAALLEKKLPLDGDGEVVLIVSGRNLDRARLATIMADDS